MSTLEDFKTRMAGNDAEIDQLKKDIKDLERKPNKTDDEKDNLKRWDARLSLLTQANEKLTDQIAMLEAKQMDLEKEKTKQMELAEKTKQMELAEKTKQAEIQLEKLKLDGSAMDERFAQLTLSQNDKDGVWAFWSACSQVQESDLEGGKIVRFPGGFLGDPNLEVSLFVRPCYPPLRDVVLHWFKKMPKLSLLGNPGIGKTFFGFYLLIWFARQGKTVIYDHGVTKCRYLFSPDGVANGDFSSFRGQLFSRDVFYIADAVKPVGCHGKTILITSPRHDIYYEWSKDDTNQLYMPVWTPEEIQECGKHIYTEVSEETWKAALAKWGGIPRRVLKNPTLSKHNDELEAAISQVDQSLLSTSVGTSNFSGVSHRLLHIVPDEKTFDFKSLKFASPYVLEKVTQRLLKNARHSLNIFLNSSAGFGQMSSLRGVLFEQVAHQTLAAGGSFRVRELSEIGEAKAGTYLTLSEMETVLFHEMPNPDTIKDKKYYQPGIKVFPCVDSFAGRNTWFQMTVSLEHKPKHQHVRDLMKALQSTNNPTLYYVVPEEIFASFQFQKYTNQDNTITQKVDNQVKGVTQYALCLKITNNPTPDD